MWLREAQAFRAQARPKHADGKVSAGGTFRFTGKLLSVVGKAHGSTCVDQSKGDLGGGRT